MKLFIDTEFTDFIDCYLINLGMVTECGEEFYVEVPYPDKACSEFVREVVLPMLGKEPLSHCPKDELRSRILNWFDIVKPINEDIEVCFDYQTDWDLFTDALDGYFPSYIKPRLVNDLINELLLFDFWKDNPSLNQHHSLHDARANAYAFRESSILSLDDRNKG